MCFARLVVFNCISLVSFFSGSRFCCLFVFSFFCLPFFSWNNFWNRTIGPKKGTGYYKVGAWFLEADQHYTDKGPLDPNATRAIFVTSLYVRNGNIDKITLMGYIPFTRVYQNE